MTVTKDISIWGSSSATDDMYLMRLKKAESGNAEFLGIKRESVVTDQIAKWWGQQSFVTKTLGEAIDSLKKTIDYNGIYNAFLLEQLTEDEFEQHSLEFISEPSNSGSKLVAEQIEILLMYTKSDFTSSEIAEIFSTSEDTVASALQQLSLDFTESSPQNYIPAGTSSK